MQSATYDFNSNVTAHTAFDIAGVKVASQTVSGHILTLTASTGSVVVADEQDFAGTDVTELVGQIFAVDPNDPNGPLSLTLSLDSSKTFDLSSIAIFDWAATISQLRMTTSKGTVVVNINSSVGVAQTFALNDAKLKGVSSVTFTDQAGNPIYLGLDNIVLDNITLPNVTPSFVGATTTLTLAQNAGASDISALLHVSDSDSGQTETWSQSSAPSHGSLSFSGATASSGSTNITPGGTITYTPTAGFAGTDSFTVQVSDGSATSTRTITVSVTPAAPGAPDLAAASDTGTSSTDNVTGAASLSFSGTSAAGDSSSTVRVFLDKNNNGSYDAGTDATATATVSNGSWTVSGLSTSGYSDGSYNAYAIVTSATGALNSATSGALSVTLDHTGPATTIGSLALSADSGSSGTDFVTNVAAQTISATLSAGLAAGEVVQASLDNGATWTDVTAMVSGTALTWTGVTLSGSGTLKLRVTDEHGNGGTAASQAYTLDTTAPGTTVSTTAFSADTGGSSTDLITATAAQTLSGTLSANVQSGEVVEVSLDNGSTWSTASTTVGQSSWTLAGQTLGGSDTLKVRVSDAAGNHGTAFSHAYVLDTTAPTVGTLVRPNLPLPASGTSFTFAVTYADGAGLDSSTFGTGNVTVKDSGNNDLIVSGFLVSGNTVTYTVTAPGGSWDSGDMGSYTIGIAGNSVKDLAGNAVAANASAHSFNITAANVLPQLGGTFSTSLNVNDNATATPFAGVTVSDADGDAISIAISYTGANGTLSGTGLSGTAGNYTLTAASPAAAQSALQALVFTPTANQVAVGSTVSTAFTLTPNDGNANGAADSTTVVIAAPVRPTATLALSDSALTAGETAVLTVTFSEAVTGFSNADLSIPHGTLGALSSSDGGRTWTATYTPTANTTSATNAFVLDLTGVQDAGGSSGQGTASTANFTVNTVPPSEPEPTGTIDGVPVVQQQGTDPVTGLATTTLTVPLVQPGRSDDPNTPNPNMADIPLSVSTGGVRAGLTISLPAGTGLVAEGPNSLLNHEQGLLDLIRRIEQKTVAGSSVQQEMTGQGANFLNDLLSSVLLKTNTLVPTAAAGQGGSHTIMIEGSSSTPAPGGEPNKSAIGLVIDATQLGSGTTLQLDNVDFAAIVGNATVRGGDGRNMVVGDGASQNIFLGADDDLLFGGAGKDIVGSAGGNDRLDGGADDDFVAGGIGDDTVIGGSGNDILQGGRSDSGQWDFYLKADGTLSARHQTAMFAPQQSETVQLAEINTSLRVMDFLSADKGTLGDIALLYHAAFGRAADIGGLNFYLRDGGTPAQVAESFTHSAEWAGLGLDQLSDSAFVNKLYQQVLGRAADAGGYQFWLDDLSGAHGVKASRASVLTGFALSAEHRTLQNTANGLALAQGSVTQESAWFANSGNDRLEGGTGSDVLEGGDGVDTAVYASRLTGYQFVLARDGQLHVVDKANGDSDILRGIEKGEFSGQQVDLAFTQAGQARLQTLGLLYEAILDRPGDLPGFAWWAGRQLNAAQYADGFTWSEEFRTRYDGMSNSAFVQTLYANSGLAESAAGGAASWVGYLDTHSRAELIGSWISQQAVIDAQYATQGLWLV